MGLSSIERETIINYNQEEKEANVFTYNPTLIRRLDELCEKSKEISLIRKGDGFAEYNFPKKWVKIKMPRQLTEEQHQKRAQIARENLAKLRGTKNAE